MKKHKRLKLPLGVIVFGLIFGFSVLGTSVIKARQVQARETEVVEEVIKMEEEDAKDEAREKKELTEEGVDYYLPYPGILPDHPFYWAKMIRDRIQLLLTTKGLVRAEKLLMYADKRLGAGWALIEGNKKDLGVSTLTKGEKYLERVGMEIMGFGDSGEEKEFKDKFIKAMLKHQQVLKLVVEKLEGGQKELVEQMIGEEKEKKGLEEVETEEEAKDLDNKIETSKEIEEINN